MRVSVIVLNFNGEGLTVGCLRALERQTFTDFEVIVVDNGSTDGSWEEIAAYLSGTPLKAPVTLIPLGRNTGFSVGNREGLAHARGDYIALLNNDTEPAPRWLGELVSPMDGDPGVGICASKLISARTGAIDSAGDGYTRALRGFKRGEGEPSDRFDEPCTVFGACAGAALYRKSMLDEIGFLDDDFFLIHEDTDLNFRAKLAGWRAVFVPGAVVLHKVTSSIGYMSPTQVYFTLRNAEFVRVKNLPLPVLLRCLPGFLVGLVSEFIFFAIRKGQPGLYVKAKKDALKGLPRMLSRRKQIIAVMKISTEDLLSEMTPLWNRAFLRAKLEKFLHG